MGIVDFIVFLWIGVALHRRRRRSAEWIRRHLDIDAALRRLPDIVGQCFADVASCKDDLMGLLSPKARRRIEHRARAGFARRLDTPGS